MATINKGLKDRFYGCISGYWAGASMGTLTKGLAPEAILQKYGPMHEYSAYKPVVDAWLNEAGPVSDLVERTKLIAQAIIEKGDRIRAEDLKAVWLKLLSIDKAKSILQPYEASLLAMARANLPASDIGRYSDYSGLNNFACSCLPISLINACDPEHAKDDAEDVGRLYQTAGSSGLQWAAISSAAVAAALKPDATVNSVLEDVLRTNKSTAVLREIEKSFETTSKCKSFDELIAAFDSLYNAVGIPYAMSFAKETVPKALCLVRFVNGDTEKAVIYGTCLGRDSGSAAALAAAICGALPEKSGLPDEWIEHIDKADSTNPYTFKHGTLSEISDEIYQALSTRIQKMQDYSSMLAALANKA